MLVLNETFLIESKNSSFLYEPSLANAVISAIQAIIIFAGSSLALTAFATLSTLRTTFNYYLISILLAELVLAFYQALLTIQEYYGYWIFSKRACTIFAFIFFCSEGIVGNAHFLICVNRIWALFFPHHYRNHNNKRVTLVLCASLWIATVILVLPWAALNEQHLTEPIIVCRVQTYDQYGFSILVMILFVSPTAFIMAMYPILYNKQRQRQRIKAGMVRNNQSRHHTSTVGRRNRSVFAIDQVAQSVVVQPGREKHSSSSGHRHVTGGGRSMGTASVSTNRHSKIKSNNFLVLSWVALCAALFWAPNVVYAVTEVFVHPNPWFNNRAFVGLCAWLACSTLLDPLMFIVTVPLLRAQVKKLLHL